MEKVEGRRRENERDREREIKANRYPSNIGNILFKKYASVQFLITRVSSYAEFSVLFLYPSPYLFNY